MKTLSSFAGGWAALSPLLDEALSLSAHERAEWLAGLSGEQASHREVLRALLERQAAVETDEFLERMPQLDTVAADPAHGLAEGSVVGAYRLIRAVGEGGMGTVWLAERSDGTMKRQVALKLPRIVWGDTFAERLGREREILATLEHEHIARLYDAGIDAQGRPFLAMEYVDGEPIDAYCSAHALSVGARINLLLQAAAAVAHAHARLVVHRDLKPGNILVSRDARVHLLDFGIAKLLEGDLTPQTALTELTGRALTLDYASPEQIRGEPLGTASDVYSLAVVAFELLAGSRPYRLKRASAAELEEAIESVQPPLASATVAEARLARQLRGDLDSILNKGLKKLPADRYPTVDAFAQDLRRWRDGEPVEARPDTLAYRFLKFVQRHRLQVGAGAVVGLALIAGLSVAMWQAREARLAAETAQAVQGFIESVFNANSDEQTDPVAARATTARELLDRGADRIDKEFASAPEAQLRLYALMADMYNGMGLNERQLALERSRLALAVRSSGPRSAAALLAMLGIGQSLESLGRREEAMTAFHQADKTARERRSDDDDVRMRIDSSLAYVYATADPPQGLERARRAAAIARREGASSEGIEALFMLGENARRAGHLTEARLALTDAVDWIERQGIKSQLPGCLSALGEVQDDLGDVEAAGITLAKAVALAELRGNPEVLHVARYKLAEHQTRNRLFREALETAAPEATWARGLRDDPSFGALPSVVMVNFGRALTAYGDAERGLAAVEEARGLLLQPTPDRVIPIFAARADALVALGRFKEAATDIERAFTDVPGGAERIPDSLRAVRRRYWVAAGRPEDALRDFREHPQKAGETDTAKVRLRRQTEEAELLLATGHDADAHSRAVDGLAILERMPERRFERDAEARLTAVLGTALLHQGRSADALTTLQKALGLHLAQYDALHSPAVAKVRQSLAEAERLVKH